MGEATEPRLPSVKESIAGTQDWPHAPPHRLEESGVYFVTARARNQHHILASDSMKSWFQECLFSVMNDYEWKLEAWAILSNHYHLIAHSPEYQENAISLGLILRKLHSLATKELNRREDKVGRTRLWHNYRETHLTFQRSYLARLHYVHQNAVHHGLVNVGSQWKWCSASVFVEAVTPAWVRTISSFGYDEIARKDGE